MCWVQQNARLFYTKDNCVQYHPAARVCDANRECSLGKRRGNSWAEYQTCKEEVIDFSVLVTNECEYVSK
eukprot:m.46602 g.46602  ORF g.46602 m.46602 type:complete len:70 (-) comp10932_c0_seq4:1273-1482(-)